MNNATPHRSWIFGIHRRATGAALTLVAVLVLGIVATPSAKAQAYKVLYSFTGGADGATPYTTPILDQSGNLYAATNYGGHPGCINNQGCGVVFKLDTAGKYSVLYTFTGEADGANFFGQALVRDAAGNLYGTAPHGGLPGCFGYGCGVVFKLDTAGKYIVLYSFTSGVDGGEPVAGLIQDAAGNLYGTATIGGFFGGGLCSGYGCGVVFKLDSTGHETVLYSFTGPDGYAPYTGTLVRDGAGNLYGTTQGGGPVNAACPYGCGVVFKLDSTGHETLLHSFTGGADGTYPRGGLLRDSAGNLYGSSDNGGDLSGCHMTGCGVVFKLDASGNYSVLHIFTGGVDGAHPYGPLIRDAAGNLFGTNVGVNGGFLPNIGASGFAALNPACDLAGCGVVFKLDTAGKYSVLYTFTGDADGLAPYAGLVQDAAGNFYGTTVGGGAYGYGTVFELTPPTATTTTALSSAPNPSTYGQAVTFTAVVSSSDGTPPDGETVAFKKGTTVLGTGVLSGGSTSFTTSTLKVGTSAIKAVYAGDSKFAASTSKAVRQVVSKATTTTALASSLNPSKVGQSVTFTASVAPQFSGTVKGTVTFYDGTTALKTVGLSGGVAKFTTKTLTLGTHNITATYNGSASFIGSSASLTQTVN